MKLFSRINIIVFLLFAVVQYNDADWWLWIPIYLFMVGLSISLVLRKRITWLYILATVAYFVGTLYVLPDYEAWINAEQQSSSLGMTLPFQEEGREAAGLFICFVVSAIYMQYSLRRDTWFVHSSTGGGKRSSRKR